MRPLFVVPVKRTLKFVKVCTLHGDAESHGARPRVSEGSSRNGVTPRYLTRGRPRLRVKKKARAGLRSRNPKSSMATMCNAKRPRSASKRKIESVLVV